jgi:hypothetical protein
MSQFEPVQPCENTGNTDVDINVARPILEIGGPLALKLGSLRAQCSKRGRGVKGDIVCTLVGQLGVAVTPSLSCHVKCRRGSGLGEKHGCVEKRRFGNERCRQGRVRHVARLCLWCVEKARGGRHMHDTLELSRGHACNIRHVFEWHAAVEWDARQHLELAQPLQARQELILPRLIPKSAQLGSTMHGMGVAP